MNMKKERQETKGSLNVQDENMKLHYDKLQSACVVGARVHATVPKTDTYPCK